MPELPDIELYAFKIKEALEGKLLRKISVFNPFLVRTVEPPPSALVGLRLLNCVRLGKRLALQFEGDYYLVLHLMVAGRLLWKPGVHEPIRPGGKTCLACLEFENGTLVITEAGAKRRASLSLVLGSDALAALNPGGLEILESSLASFSTALTQENRTVKRVLTDPHVFSGIGNAYSDEILHEARIAPTRLTKALKPDEISLLYKACRDILTIWTVRLQRQFQDRFPGSGEVTAFRPDFAVHGKFGKPCPVCGKPVQRIKYADNESNYCAVCQNGGRLLADRGLSRLLKGDWPRTLEEE